MTEFFSRTDLESLTKVKLLSITKKLGIKNVHNKKKKEIVELILSHEDPSEKYDIIPINDTKYDYIYHISDIHIRPLHRHREYNEVFENLYTFLETKTTSNIIAITGDILHEKDNLKPETVLLCRNFIKNLSKYGTVVIITGNHDMLENNSDRLDNLTAIVDDLPVHYLVNSGAYQFGNIVLVVSSLVDKKFIRSTQVVNPDNLLTAAMYHGTINGSVNDVGYVIEDTTSYSTRFRKISDFDGYDLVLLGDIHKHQYLKTNMAYPSSLIQQNFGENLEEHGVLEWNIKTKKAVFYPIQNRYGFINIYVNNNIWNLPNTVPEKPYVRLLLKNTDNEQVEQIRQELDKKFELQSFKTKQLTDECKAGFLLPEEITNHQDDIDILNEEMDVREFTDLRKEHILDIHRTLKSQCFDDNMKYDMNNQNWKILKLSFKNVFIFGENKTNVIDFSTLNGITTIVGPNAIGKSNIINIIIFLLYGSNVNFKVPHILNKYQKEYFIECELMFGAKKYKIRKTGKKRKGNKLNHSFSLYIHDDKWIKQDEENNKATAKVLKSLLGTVNEFLLTNVYSNSSLRTILTLTNSEKHKALGKLFCLDIYETLEKLAKKDVSEIKKQCAYLEGEKKGLLYSFEERDLARLRKDLCDFKKSITNKKVELKNLEDKKVYLTKEKDIILDKKDKCSSQIQYLEEKDFDTIRDNCKKYELEHSCIINKTNMDIEELRSKYYRLEGSIIKIKTIPDNLDIDFYRTNKKSLHDECERYNDSIEQLHQKQENIQVTLNNINRQIVDLSNITIVDNSVQLNELEQKCKNTEELNIKYLNIEDAQEKLIQLKSKLVSFVPNENPIVLPFEYNHVLNEKIIREVEADIKQNEALFRNNENEMSQIRKHGTPDNFHISGKTLDERDRVFKVKIEEFEKKIKQIRILPKVELDENTSIQLVEAKIKEINKQSNFVSQNQIQNHIDKLVNFQYNPAELLTIKDTIGETICLLKLIKENVNNTSTIQTYEKLSKLLQYKTIYYKNIENTENNKRVSDKIRSLQYWHFHGNNEMLKNKINILHEKLKKCLQYQYSYYYSLYEKCCNLENFIEYKKCLKEQEKYVNFVSQKQKNVQLIDECKNQEEKIKLIKAQILDHQNSIKKVSGDIFENDETVRIIEIHNANNDISVKMIQLQKYINEQLIRDTYNILQLSLEDEDKYNEIKNKNNKLLFQIEKYGDIIQKLETELSYVIDTYITMKSSISSIEKEISLKTSKINELDEIKRAEGNINNQIFELKKDISFYEDYINLVNKNNIPVKLINKKNSYIQNHINTFLERLTKFTISIDTDTKNGICFSAHKNGLILDVNQLSGYETFILNIALKSALNKYSFISKSTLFILDEGLDVVDKDNFKKLNLLMKLLMKHYKHILLISHMPKVKDLQHNEVNIQNNGKSSFIV
jgi:DNA repair exonuclease SbcCD ATPase subunit